MTQMEPVIDCTQAKGLLSDLLDVRRGEQPSPVDSPLGTPAVLHAVQAHVAECDSCNRELRELEEIGLAFAEYNLGDQPAEHFSGYGRLVRESVLRAVQPAEVPYALRPVSTWRTWVSAVVASAAAAVLTVFLLAPEQKPEGAVEQVSHQVSPPVKTTPDTVEVVQKEGLTEPTVASERIDLPSIEPRDLPLQVWTRDNGPQVVKLSPQGDKTYPVSDLQARYGPILLGDPAPSSSGSTGLVGIAFAPSNERGGPDGLHVVAVKRHGPADCIGLKPEDRLLSMNGVAFAESSPDEIMKFFNAVNSLGRGKLIQVDYARKIGSDWIVKRGKAELGHFE